MNAKKILRVFSRKTNATPNDDLAFFDTPGLWVPECDEVHVSVSFSYDLPCAEFLAKQWEAIGVPVLIGGPATGDAGDEFIPGRYLKPGYTITSRGCPRRCWFCEVWKRKGGDTVRELPIRHGHIILDDNLLACSDDHIRAVFAMLANQADVPSFAGGLDPKFLRPWIAESLAALRFPNISMAYDTPDDLDPLMEAGKLLRQVGFRDSMHRLSCYVLIGYRGDTFEKAEQRMRETITAGFLPFAMLYRDETGNRDPEWISFQKQWADKYIVGKKFNAMKKRLDNMDRMDDMDQHKGATR